MIIERFATQCPCWSTNKNQQSLPVDKQSYNYRAYYQNFATRDIYLILHSLGCSRASAEYQASRWDVPTNNNAIAHAVIDSNSGDTIQVLEWGMRGWHVGAAGNNLSIGIEMCESDAIAYDQPKSWMFSVKDRAKATKHCRTAYNGAVETFAYLCKLLGLDPMMRILSHKEGHDRGIASNHGDPEHYWTGLGMSYTMDGFRADVAAAMADADNDEDALLFPDVPADAWYADALKWAVEKSIVLPSGKPFNPDLALDKATFIVLLRRSYIALLKALQGN